MKTPRGGSRRGRGVSCVRRGAFGVALAGLLAGAPEVRAQDMPPFDPAVDVQLFEYAIGPKSFVTVTDGNVQHRGQFGLDFLVTFFTDPLTVYEYDEDTGTVGDERTAVVDSVFAGQLVGAYGLTDRIQLGASLPVIFSMTGDGLNPGDAMPSTDGLQATGLGDLLLEVKALAWRNDSLSLAGTGGLTVPSSVGSGGGDYLGDDLPTGRLRGALQWRAPGGRLTAGANLGVLLRKPRTIYATEIGQQLTYGLAAAIQATDRLAFVGELYGRGDLGNLDLDTSPLESTGAARLRVGKSLSVLLGGGAGLTQGLGSPGFRLFAAVGYAPDFRDSDGDGVANQDDACPLVAEDVDGFEDHDGCADQDNDGDRRLDAEDRCPNEAEDLDGFDDDDGCPELDNDKDGIADFDDRCAQHAEDGVKPFEKDGCPANMRDNDADGIMDDMDGCVDEPEDDDGFEDWDGCPDLDNDKDGVPDADDRCKLCMEDKDSFEDDDGCPELDNDTDGVADASDKCAAEAETINGIQDEDGCPDTGGQQLATLEGNIVQLGAQVTFDRRDSLQPAGLKVVGQAAAVMRMHPTVARWRVVVAAPKQRNEDLTRRKSQRQADAIRLQLVAKGIPNDAIEAIGAVSDRTTVAIAVVERIEVDPSEDGGLAMCPASMRAVERQPPAGGATAMTGGGEQASGDRDGDGLMDGVDQCPEESGPAENRGCPDTDLDEDGVLDRLDNCPDEKGTAANQGCVAKQLVVITQTQLKILDTVHFDTGKASIKRRSFPLLDNVAAVLLKHPKISRVRVEGHTDDRGNDEKNRTLSQARAESVRDYLVSKGVPAERLDAYGFGEEKPIADNRGSKGRAANRRVEFNIVE